MSGYFCINKKRHINKDKETTNLYLLLCIKLYSFIKEGLVIKKPKKKNGAKDKVL
jgi:hypothetical protein